MSLWLPISEGRPKGKELGGVSRAKYYLPHTLEDLPLSTASVNNLSKISLTALSNWC